MPSASMANIPMKINNLRRFKVINLAFLVLRNIWKTAAKITPNPAIKYQPIIL